MWGVGGLDWWDVGVIGVPGRKRVWRGEREEKKGGTCQKNLDGRKAVANEKIESFGTLSSWGKSWRG